MTYQKRYITMIDPMRITDRRFGGPQFKTFELIPDHRIKDPDTGDVFDVRGIAEAWHEGRNLMPILFGEGRRAVIVDERATR